MCFCFQRGGLVLSCLKPETDRSDSYHRVESSPGSPEKKDSAGVDSLHVPDLPDDVFALVTPPRDQFRSKRHSSTRASIISRRSFEDLDMVGAGSTHFPFDPMPLDLEDVVEWLTPDNSSVCQMYCQVSFQNGNLLLDISDTNTCAGQ